MAIPTPKEVARNIARMIDQTAENIRGIGSRGASALQLPELPALPSLEELFAGLPEIPAPPWVSGSAVPIIPTPKAQQPPSMPTEERVALV